MDERDREKIYSKRVRAGKRTYFFDVKSTARRPDRASDYYLTITESRRQAQGEGFVYEKHKIFLYKEDFHKFINSLQETIDYVKTELLPDVDFEQFVRPERDEQDNFASELKWE